MANGKRSQAKQIVIQERRQQALDLRRSGASLRQIAAQLNVSAKQIQRDIDASLQATIAENNKRADRLRAMEIERLDNLLLRIQSLIIKGDLKAIDRALRISEQRAKLLGLYAPVKTEHSGKIEVTWQDEAVEAIKTGKITYDAALEAFDNDLELVHQLFAKAAVPVRQGD